MNFAHRHLHLALKKQRLQYRCDAQRAALQEGIQPLLPLFNAVEAVRCVVNWVRDKPALSIAVAVILIVARPRLVMRWGKRAIVAWQAWRKIAALNQARRGG